MTEGEQTIEGQDGQPIAAGDDKLWALIAHLGGLLTSFVVPLVVWLVKKDESDFVADQSKEALNFQITVLIVSLFGAATTICLLGFVVLIVISLVDLIFSLVAALRAYDGHRYRYPFTLRLF